MKCTLLLVLGAITASVVANPISDPLDAPSLLEPRADKWCRLHDDVTSTGRCRSCPSTSCDKVRDISKSDRFGVNCVTTGDPDPIHGN
ncbi:hypothetical protein FRC00_001757, partial [Tulasnella sp. 408]